MYQFNPLLLESNVTSFQKFVSKILKTDPNKLKRLKDLRRDILKTLPKQQSLPGFDIRNEKKLKIIDSALNRLKELDINKKNAVRKGFKYNPYLVRKV
jgi:hypothetical protein